MLLSCCFDFSDFIEYIHSGDDFAENAVTKISFATVVKKSIIFQVDKKLIGGTVNDACSRHSDCTAFVAETIVGFVLIPICNLRDSKEFV